MAKVHWKRIDFLWFESRQGDFARDQRWRRGVSLSIWRIGYGINLTLAGLVYGSTLVDGRWHTNCSGSVQVVYCGSSRALCQLEKHVHLNGAMPRAASLALMRLVIPPHTRLVQASDLGLPDDWRIDVAATQRIGMTWLEARASLGMWVPSFVEPAENNLIPNLVHRAYEAVQLVIEQNPFAFNLRLFG